ncbi:MAG: metal-dependent hydrolase [Acidobacteria bacterium]|nr:MAG: metal-dependent hydrolase [Acidobacteriota bacterium]
MPTPLGHALGGIAAGALVAGRSASNVSIGQWRVPMPAVCGLFGMLADIDFFLGGHRGVTHTVAAALAAGGLMAVVDRRPAVWLAAAAAYGTHVLLDWLGTDTVAPIGIMAFWPFDQTFYLSPYHWFPPVCRQYWLTECWVGLAGAMWWELLLLGPPALVGLLLAGRSRTADTGPDR